MKAKKERIRVEWSDAFDDEWKKFIGTVTLTERHHKMLEIVAEYFFGKGYWLCTDKYIKILEDVQKSLEKILKTDEEFKTLKEAFMHHPEFV